ncbi:MAG: site-2 protease family protein, partial [Candidatus Latescibacteria bacterium]|nr:site-2 protease family protein [Candidatus Latescibacterota bacterium]
MFGRRITVFTIMGFDIRVDLSWIIIAAVISWSLATAVFPSYLENQSSMVYWIMGVLGAIGLFASVTFHELSHSVVARRFGLPIEGITLFIFGGVSEMKREPDSPAAEFYMAIAGPAASIAAGVAFLAVAYQGRGWPATAVTVIRYLGIINLVLAGFNLLPAFPLDGGRMLRAGLWKLKKDLHRATVISARVGKIFGFILISAGILFLFRGSVAAGFWWIFIGMFLRGASQQSILRSRITESLRGVDVVELMRKDPETLPAEATAAEIKSEYLVGSDLDIFPVLKDGWLEGLVQRDMLEKITGKQGNEITAVEMAEPCGEEDCIPADQEAVEAMHRLRRKGADARLLVTRGKELAGTISLND